MEVVIFIGLQATGKSTCYRSQFASSHFHISKDNFRNNPQPHRRQEQLIQDALAQGQSVVVDNTNLTCEDRKPLIALARSSDARVIGYYFASSLSACLERNQQREGKARVPDVALFAATKRLQLPSFAEGFDELFYVRIAENGAFEIESWQEGTATDAEHPV